MSLYYTKNHTQSILWIPIYNLSKQQGRTAVCISLIIFRHAMSRDLKRRQNKYGIDSGDIIVSPKLLAAQTAYKNYWFYFSVSAEAGKFLSSFDCKKYKISNKSNFYDVYRRLNFFG